MIGLSAQFLNLNDPATTYFDYEMIHTQIGTGFQMTQTSLPLVPCTEEHYSFTEETINTYKQNLGTSWLCPSMNQSLAI